MSSYGEVVRSDTKLIVSSLYAPGAEQGHISVNNLDLAGFTHVLVDSAAIPLTFFAIREGRDRFVMREDGTPTEVVLQRKSYSAIALRETLQNALNAVCTYTYTVEFEADPDRPQDGKFTFTANDPDVPITMEFPPGSNLCEVFGFSYHDATHVEGVILPFEAGVLVSDSVADLSPCAVFQIRSNIVRPTANNVDLLFGVNLANTPTFAYLPYSSGQHSEREINNNTVSSIDIYFTDEDDLRISITNQWSIVLRLLEKRPLDTNFMDRLYSRLDHFISFYAARATSKDVKKAITSETSQARPNVSM